MPGWLPLPTTPRSLHGIFQARILEWVAMTQGSNRGLLYHRQILYILSQQGSPELCWTLTVSCVRYCLGGPVLSEGPGHVPTQQGCCSIS